MKSILFFLLCLLECAVAQIDSTKTAPQLFVDPAPADMPRAPIEVHARQQGGERWQPLFVYHADSMSKQVHDFGGAHGFCIIDHSTVRNVLYENIHAEGTKDISLQVTTLRYTSDEQRGRIDGVTIRNYLSDAEPKGSVISGHDDGHAVENVLIENFVAFFKNPERRQVIGDADALRLKTRFARNIRIRQP